MARKNCHNNEINVSAYFKYYINLPSDWREQDDIMTS